MDGYLIPRKRLRVVHNVSNSRFITTVAKASSVEESKAFIREIRDEMPDATHHVYAFIIGHGKSVTEGMSDDGEPCGTAGPPAMAVVRGSGVGDIVLVITRYFGGTKLGTGGLVAAYGSAAKKAMKSLATEEKIDRDNFSLDVPYTLHDAALKTIEMFKGRVQKETFSSHIVMTCDVPSDNLDSLAAALREISSGELSPEITE